MWAEEVWAEEASRAETRRGMESLSDQGPSRGMGKKRPVRLEPALPGARAAQRSQQVCARGGVGVPTVPGASPGALADRSGTGSALMKLDRTPFTRSW